MAKEKMDVVKKKFPNDLILTADTIVSLGGKILGKPENKDHAISMLLELFWTVSRSYFLCFSRNFRYI